MREKQSDGGGFVYFSGNKHPRADRFYAGELWQVGGRVSGGLEMLFCRFAATRFFFFSFFYFTPLLSSAVHPRGV